MPGTLPAAIAAFNSAVDQWFNQRSSNAIRDDVDSQIYGLDHRTGIFRHVPEGYGEERLEMQRKFAQRRNDIIRTGNELVPLLVANGKDELAIAVQAVTDAARDGNPSHIVNSRSDLKAKLGVLAVRLEQAEATRPVRPADEPAPPVAAPAAPPAQTEKSEGEKPPPGAKAGRRGGRPKLSASNKPEVQAKVNLYKLVRGMKEANPSWGKKELHSHFKANRDFQLRVKEAGKTFGVRFFHAALGWIKTNPSSQEIPSGQETRSGNVS